MKKFYLFIWTVIIFSVFFQLTFSQTPQYYNSTAPGVGNTLPFGSLAIQGYKTQWLIGPNEYAQPTPAPAGDITKFYIYISASGSGTYSQLTVKMGQTSITSFTPGEYTGPMNTVYFNASASLTATMNSWVMITLDSAFTYTPSQSLVIQISHCGFSAGAGFNVWQIAGTTGIIRRNNIPGNTSCVFNYSSQDTRTLQCGVDISVPIGIVNNNIPAGYRLEQNYPNPFNPLTNINFSIPVNGFVNLTVYDVLGIKVNELLNENIKAGNYSVNFNAVDLSSGAYFYTIRVNDFTATKKMLLIK